MNAATPTRSATVVYESMFGNTAAIAQAVADGLFQAGIDVVAADVRTAARQQLTGDLLVLGAPTHAFSLSRPNTRADAVRQVADAPTAETGLREWLATATPGSPAPVVATFDTRVDKVRRLPFGAARAAARIARRQGFEVIGKPMGFIVTDTKGPLAEDEIERASTWGRTLAEHLTPATGGRDARVSRHRRR